MFQESLVLFKALSPIRDGVWDAYSRHFSQGEVTRSYYEIRGYVSKGRNELQGQLLVMKKLNLASQSLDFYLLLALSLFPQLTE